MKLAPKIGCSVTFKSNGARGVAVASYQDGRVLVRMPDGSARVLHRDQLRYVCGTSRKPKPPNPEILRRAEANGVSYKFAAAVLAGRKSLTLKRSLPCPT